MNTNRQILHKLQKSLRKKKFNKEIYNVYVTMLTVSKNIISFNFEEKDEIFQLKSSATSIKIKENEISITLKFNTLILID